MSASATIIPFPTRMHHVVEVPAIVISPEDVRRVVNAALETCWYTLEGMELPLLAVSDALALARHPGLDRQLAADAADFLDTALGWLTEARDRARTAARDAGPLILSSGGSVVRWTELRFACDDLLEAVDLLRARGDGRTPMHLTAPEDDQDDDGDGGVPG